MPGGHESTYTPEVGARLCELLCSRDEEQPDTLGRKPFYSVRTACLAVGISEATIYRWLHRHPDFCEEYTRAREARAHLLAEETIEVVEAEPDPAKARVRMDVRKWYAGQLAPKVWGTKVMGDPNNPVTVEVKDEAALAEFRSRIARLTARGGEGSGDPVDKP